MVRDGNVSLKYAQLAIIEWLTACITCLATLDAVHCTVRAGRHFRARVEFGGFISHFGLLVKHLPTRKGAKYRRIFLVGRISQLSPRWIWTMKLQSCLHDNSRYQRPL